MVVGELELKDPAQLQRDIKRRRLIKSTVVHSQAFSNEGSHLAAGSNCGDVCIWNIAAAFEQDTERSERSSPIYSFKAHPGTCIYSMVTINNLLITAGGPELCAWNWKDLQKADSLSQPPKCVWQSRTAKSADLIDYEINSLAIHNKTNKLYAGSGDGSVYIFDLSSGKQLGALIGHRKYVHSVVVLQNSDRCATASEDGTVRLWDLNAARCISTLSPYKKLGLKSGSWISSVAVDESENWLGCGGGDGATLWHLRSNTFVVHLDTKAGDGSAHAPGHTVTDLSFTKHGVRTIGNSSTVIEWSFAGDLQRTSESSSPELFTSQTCNNAADQIRVTTVAGASRTIDVYFADGRLSSIGLTFEPPI